ncbi:hypothetical protein Val02_50650 [Virgisporangium aliadipatigenens]|uniref:Knr4/Smi1-like domain-containing protein n=1 Tax=Virgisporangium aliadipatigenens TaxID=741659 RepID=A0A8J3YMD8_9ACTN|nr:SMI1/KNR4 family protein [Virgisporangium aliadipatigenens]GIJ48179.1 hypothetical protein Val02_50650 [Virgisporangium aliadipatigenens]
MSDLTGAGAELARLFAPHGHTALQAVFKPGASIVRPIADRRTIDALRAVADRLRPPGEERTLIVELRLDAAGAPVLTHTFELEWVSPAVVVLDPSRATRRLPGVEVPADFTVSDRPTDPGVLAAVRALVEEFTAQYRRIKGGDPGFPPGHTEEEILAAETRIGLRLPEDVRALYRLIGDDREEGLLGAQNLMPLEQVVEWHADDSPGAFDLDGTRLLTLTHDAAMNYGAVDLAPGDEGVPGRLVEYGRDHFGPPGHVADSITALMRQVVAALKADDYKIPQPEFPRLEIGAGIGKPPEDERSDPYGGTKKFFAEAGAVLDLAALREFPRVREVTVDGAARVHGRLPHDLAVEELRLDAAEADLAALAGHPTLRTLAVSGVRAAVPLAPLAGLPALDDLDLSAVDVPDLDRIGDLRALRVLTLSPAQWRHLRAANAVPRGLAVAALGGHTPLAEAIEWASQLRTHG